MVLKNPLKNSPFIRNYYINSKMYYEFNEDEGEGANH
jgi:hypothetical protein